MRQGQQNRRGRGRSRKGGGHHNPLTRSYESNGPDVKIRGTPAHIAEKYISLARDAQSSGDPVLAENYLQHAEHYNRIIMAFREQQMQQGGSEGMNGGMRRPFPGGVEPFDGGDDFDDEGEDEDPMHPSQRSPEAQPQQPRAFEPQARHDDRGHRGDRPQRHHDGGQRQHREPFGQQRQFDRYDRQDRNERQERFDRQERQERHERPERAERTERPDHQERSEPGDRPERSERPQRVAIDPGAGEQPSVPREQAPRRRERFADQGDQQPEFLRRPVRRPRKEAQEAASGSDDAAGDANPVDKTTA